MTQPGFEEPQVDSYLIYSTQSSKSEVISAEHPIKLEPHMIVVDPITGSIYHRDARGELWNTPITDKDQLDGRGLPALPTQSEQGPWRSTGPCEEYAQPREIHHDYLVRTLDHCQTGATEDECGVLGIGIRWRTEHGLIINIHDMNSNVPPGREEQSRDDVLELLEALMIENPEAIWEPGSAWVEIVVDDGDMIRTRYAASLDCGTLCSCRIQDLTRELMRQWTGPMREDSDTLERNEPHEIDEQIVAAILFIGGTPKRFLPQAHIMLGQARQPKELTAAIPTERILN